jgi:ABC-2 type transport system ATP-binding protein
VSATAAITCEGLVKRYGPVAALDGLDLEVPAGSLFGFLGPNGAGKTTTIRLLTGLAWPTAGRATVAGLDPTRGGPRLARMIGHQDQQPRLYGWMSGRELLQFAGRLFGLSGARLRARIDEVLRLTGLTEAAKRRVGGYSVGMRQRLGLAQAMLHEPELLFLDEPVSSLDPAGRHEVLELLASLRGRVTVFMSSHILGDVERVCDRVGIVDRGRLVVESTVADLQSRFAQPVFVVELESGQAADEAGLRAALQRVPLVRRVGRDGAEIRVVADDPTRAGPEILRVLAASGAQVARFERLRPSLEDIFLRLVPGPRAAAEEGA